jgi:hypothetical protein
MTVGCTPCSNTSSAFFRNSPASTAAVIVQSPTSGSCDFHDHLSCRMLDIHCRENDRTIIDDYDISSESKSILSIPFGSRGLS